MNPVSIIDVGNEEQIVRVLNKDWIVDGILQISAFALRDNETYLSVNRPSIDSYADDVREFISGHPAYKMTDNSYQCAELNVGSVRDVSICFKQKMAGISVEVEPRRSHFKSHAGVFTRIEDKNIKGGQKDEVALEDGQVVSYEDIHLKVQYALLELSQLETCMIPDTKETV